VPRTSNGGNSTLLSVGRGPARWVAVGTGGTVISSPTGVAWTLRGSGTANTLSSVAFGNGMFIAAGDGGTIIASTDGATWDVQDSTTTASLKQVQFLNNQFFAVGANGTILNSADGVVWQNRISGTSGPLSSVAYGNGFYVATGADPGGPCCDYYPVITRLLRSTDGVVWDNISTQLPVNAVVEKLAFLNDTFWLCGQQGMLLQTDSTNGYPVLAGTLATDMSSLSRGIVPPAPPAYRVQVSPNLTFPWQEIDAVTSAKPPYVWTDANLSGSALRLYRLVAP